MGRAAPGTSNGSRSKSLLKATGAEVQVTDDQALDILEQSARAIAKDTGRPSTFTGKMAKRILSELMEGKTLAKICEPEDMPNPGTVWVWRQRHPAFSDIYERVRSGAYADSLVDQALNRAFDAQDKEDAACARVASETALKVASRINPQRWGERGDPSGGINVQIVTPLFGQDSLDEQTMVIEVDPGAKSEE